ncbi:MAG: hypothetical protein ACKOQM_00670 [Novosphingobium sp.]
MKRRFQIYMRMVDISFWVTALFLVRFVARLFGHPLFVPSDTASAVLFVVNFLGFVLAIFIVLARFMRDEHAERVWQLTARRFVNVMVTGSALAAVLLPALEERVNRYVFSRDWSLPPEFVIVGHTAEQTVMKGIIGGIGLAIMAFGIFAPMIFIVLYKWALWRDAR